MSKKATGEPAQGASSTPASEAAEQRRIISLPELMIINDLPEEEVFIPQWNAYVRIRAFTKKKQLELRKAATRNGEIDEQLLETLMVVHGVVEPQLTQEHVGLLLERNAGAVDTILRAILRLSGLDGEAVKRAEAAFRQGS